MWAERGTVAAACEKFKAWLVAWWQFLAEAIAEWKDMERPMCLFSKVHLSADCVFDGTKPPYSVESRPNPLSEYGCFAASYGQEQLPLYPKFSP